ncbi:MAG: DNA-processing protein DprA [Planctomycetota bacterium]|jgi:DNA processing protein
MDESEVDPIILHRLALTRGIGYRKFCKLREAFPKIESVFSAPKKRLAETTGIGKKLAAAISDPGTEEAVRTELERAEAEGISILYHGHLGYPDELVNIDDPPLLLYAKGDVSALAKPGISIVGSRRCGVYGLKQAESLGRELARSGFAVVSGLARGADAAAHRGALDKGATIAVLGCGVDVIYPPEHEELYGKISESGCVLSEFPFGTPPEAGNFPRRNRIIAGLSIGTLVIQAGARSGALITARFAAEQGKPVFALPGRIDAESSVGSNRLIKDGAHLVENVRDILEIVAPDVARRRSELDEGEPGEKPAPPADLSENAKKVLAVLEADPMQVDMIIGSTGLAAEQVAPVLLDLELRRLAVRHPGQRYSLP